MDPACQSVFRVRVPLRRASSPGCGIIRDPGVTANPPSADTRAASQSVSLRVYRNGKSGVILTRSIQPAAPKSTTSPPTSAQPCRRLIHSNISCNSIWYMFISVVPPRLVVRRGIASKCSVSRRPMNASVTKFPACAAPAGVCFGSSLFRNKKRGDRCSCSTMWRGRNG